jgi:hypothetical protein
LQGIKITVLGDSLVHRPFTEYKFFDVIKGYITTDQRLTMYDEGQNGNKISDISSRLDTALAHNSQGLILQWDSDVSDIDESAMSDTEITILRQNYENNLKSVIERIQANQTDVVALSGPGLLGEPGILQLFLSSRFRGKENMLNDYREMNKQIALAYNITYLDLRTALQQAVPYWLWIFGRWFTTVDGEHLNAKGTVFVIVY